MTIYKSTYKIRNHIYDVLLEQTVSSTQTNFGHPVRIYKVKAYKDNNIYLFQYSPILKEMLDVYIDECNKIISECNVYNAYPCFGCEREEERCKCNIYKDWIKTMWREIRETFNTKSD